MTITTEEAESFARQLENNDPSVSDPVAIEFFSDVATALRTLAAERDRARRAREAAARAQGVAVGKLAASEMAGVVQGWKERAERAEAEAERLRDSVTAVIIAYEHDIAQGVEPSEDRRRVIAVLRAALEGGDNAR